MRRAWMVVTVGIAVAVPGCGGDDAIDAATFHGQADAVFCADLVSARDTLISGVTEADGPVRSDAVAAFAAGYEPILRDHIAALQALRHPAAEGRHVTAVADAAAAVADRLRAVAADPTTTATASTADELRALATSPALIERLTAAGLRTC
jgi:hypothetical protein